MKKIFLLVVSLFLVGCGTLTPELQQELSRKEQQKEIAVRYMWDEMYDNNYETALTISEELKKQLPQKYISHSSILRAEALSSFALNDSTEAMSLFLQSFRDDLTNPYTLACGIFMINNGLFTREQQKEFYSLAEKAAYHKKTPSWMKREYLTLVFDYYYKSGSFSAAEKIAEEMNILKTWTLHGPYSNISGSAYNKEFISPGIMPAESSSGGLKTFIPQIETSDRFIALSEYFSSQPYTSAYAVKTIIIDEEDDYTFSFSKKGSLEVWLDEEKILSDREYSSGDNVFTVSRRLKKGKYTLTVKGNSLEESSAFSVSLWPGETLKSSHPLWKNLYSGEASPSALINELLYKADEESHSSEGLFWLSYILTEKGFHDASHETSNMLYKENNKSDLIRWVNILRDKNTGNFSSADREILKMGEREKPFTPALVYTAINYIQNNRVGVANFFIGNSMKKESYYALFSALLLHSNRGDIDNARTIYRNLKTAYPGILQPDLLALTTGNFLNYQEINDIEKRLLKEGEYRTVLFNKWLNMTAAGTSETALLRTLCESYPINEEFWTDYIETLINTGSVSYKVLREEIIRAAETFPFSKELITHLKGIEENTYYSYNTFHKENPALFHKKTPQVKEFLSEMETARKNYTNSLKTLVALSPEDIYIRDEMRRVNNKKEFLETITKDDSVYQIKNFKKYFLYDKADAVILYDKNIQVYYGDGATTEFRHIILKLNSLNAIEANRYVDIGFDPFAGSGELLEAFTYKKDGTQIDAQLSGTELAFSGISPGDYIVYSYRYEDYDRNPIHKEIFTRVNLAHFYPIIKKDVEIIYPSEYKLSYQFNNTEKEKVKRSNSTFMRDYKKTVFRVRDSEPLNVYNLTPGMRDFVPSVDITSADTWEKLIQWYEPVYLGQCRVTRAIEEKSQALTRGIEDEKEKIKVIFDFVANKIEYENLTFMRDGYIPQTADSVLKEGFGDCKDQSVLLIALLKAAGIDSHMVLNATYYNGDKAFIPSEIFDHVFVAIPQDGDEYLYLDPTLTYLSFGDMPAERDGTYLLHVKEGGEFIRASYDIAEQKNQTLLKLNNIHEKTEIKGSFVYQGHSAWDFRRIMKEQKPDEQKIRFRENMYWLPGVLLNELQVEGVESIINDPTAEFTGEMDSLLTPVSSRLYRINTPWRQFLEAEAPHWLSAEAGSAGIAVNSYYLSSPQIQTVIVEIPRGYTLYNLPEDRILTHGESYIRFTYKKEGNQLICTREMYIPHQILSGEEADVFKDFLYQGLLAERDEIYLNR